MNLKCYKTAEGYEDTLHSFTHSVTWNCVNFYATTKARMRSPRENISIWLVDFAKTLALSSYSRLTVMAVQLTAILLGHAHPFNNSCRAHELERAALTSSASLRSMACKSDCPHFGSDPYCRTALGVQRDLVKKSTAIYCQHASIPVTPSCTSLFSSLAVYTVSVIGSAIFLILRLWGTSYEFASVAKLVPAYQWSAIKQPRVTKINSSLASQSC